MNLIRLYPIGPFQQAMLAAIIFSSQLLLAEKSSVTVKRSAPFQPVELITDFEDHRNHGIGD